MNWLNHALYGGTVLEWSVAIGITLLLAPLFFYARGVIVNRLRRYAVKTKTPLDDFAVELLGGTRFLFLLALAIYLGAQYLELPARPARILDSALIVVLLLQAAFWGNRAIAWWLARAVSLKRETDAAGATTVSVLGFIARVVLWSVIVLMMLDNVGVNITALVASLGIGGIAVALAVQNILGDIFASLSIALDKPFVIGDFIIVGDMLGTVEYIGLKTTRIRSLSGEQLVFANADLLGSRIRNYKRMFERRVLFGFGVTYDTPADVLERIQSMVREIVEAQQQVRFDRAHFKEYGDSSLNFEVVFYVLSPDYNIYMDIQQAINLALFRRFEKEGISFAFPTRTLHVHHATPAPEAR